MPLPRPPKFKFYTYDADGTERIVVAEDLLGAAYEALRLQCFAATRNPNVEGTFGIGLDGWMVGRRGRSDAVQVRLIDVLAQHGQGKLYLVLHLLSSDEIGGLLDELQRRTQA